MSIDCLKILQGKTNLELAIYTYLCYKNEELVPEVKNEANLQKNTLLVACEIKGT